MFHAAAYIPIFAAAATEVVIAIIWYSEMVFGPLWRKNGGKAPSQKDLYSKVGMHALASLLRAAALFIAISVFQKTQTAMYAKEGIFKLFSFFLQDNIQNNSLESAIKTAGFIFFGFIVPTKVIHTIWGTSNWSKFIIEATGQLTSFLAMAAVIASLS